MSSSQKETDFEFYLKFAKPLVLNLGKPDDRVLAAAWIQKLRDENAGDVRLRTDYLKLLLFVLQRKKLIGVFTENPAETETLNDFPTTNLYDIAKQLLEAENANRKEAGSGKPITGSGDFPPYSTEHSADLLEYSAAQDIPNFGVHAYYAISIEPLPNWDRTEKAVFPKGAASVSERAEGRAVTPSKLSTAVSEPTLDKDKSKTPTAKSKSRARSRSRSKSTTPQGSRTPSPTLRSQPKPDDERSPPTWGSNLIGVSEPIERDFVTKSPASEPLEMEDLSVIRPEQPCSPCSPRTPGRERSPFKPCPRAAEYSPQFPTGEADAFFLESPPSFFERSSPPPCSPVGDSEFSFGSSLYPSLPYQTPPRYPCPATNISAGSSLYASLPYQTPSLRREDISREIPPLDDTVGSSLYASLPYQTPSPQRGDISSEIPPFDATGGSSLYASLPYQTPSPRREDIFRGEALPLDISTGSSQYPSLPYQTPSPKTYHSIVESTPSLPYRTPSPRVRDQYSLSFPLEERDPFFLESPPSYFEEKSPPRLEQEDYTTWAKYTQDQIDSDLREFEKMLDEFEQAETTAQIKQTKKGAKGKASKKKPPGKRVTSKPSRTSTRQKPSGKLSKAQEDSKTDLPIKRVCPGSSQAVAQKAPKRAVPTSQVSVTGTSQIAAPGTLQIPAPGISRIRAPGASRISAPGISHMPPSGETPGLAPGTSRIPAPGASRIPAPGTSRIPAPGTSRIPAPGTSRVPAPGTSQIPAPGTSRIPPPGASRIPGPGTSRIPAPGISRIPAPGISRIPPPQVTSAVILEAAKTIVPDAVQVPQAVALSSPLSEVSQILFPETATVSVSKTSKIPALPGTSQIPSSESTQILRPQTHKTRAPGASGLPMPKSGGRGSQIPSAKATKTSKPGEITVLTTSLPETQSAFSPELRVGERVYDKDLLKELGLNEEDLKDIDVDIGNVSQFTVDEEEIEYEEEPDLQFKDKTIDEQLDAFDKMIADLEEEHAEDIALYGSPVKAITAASGSDSQEAEKIIKEASKIFELSSEPTSLSTVQKGSPEKIDQESFPDVEEFDALQKDFEVPTTPVPLKRPKTMRVESEGQEIEFEFPEYESPSAPKIYLESPPLEYYRSPSPEKPKTSPSFGLPEVKHFSPIKQRELTDFPVGFDVPDVISRPAKPVTPTVKIQPKELEDIDLYVRPERKELIRRTAELVSDIPDTAEVPHQFKEWDLPNISDEEGILEETPPPCESPVCTSPISPIYSPSFKKSIQEHEYTEQFFDKNRPKSKATMVMSGGKVFQIQRKSKAPALGQIVEKSPPEKRVEPIFDLPKPDYYGSPGRKYVRTPAKTTHMELGILEELPPTETDQIISPTPKTPKRPERAEMYFESPPQEYYGSPGSPMSPEEAEALPAPFGLPKLKQFSPIKKPEFHESRAREQMRQIMEKSAKQLELLDSPPPTIEKDDEDIDYFVHPSRRELLKRVSKLVSDVPDTFQRPFELREWDLPPVTESDGILEETPPPESPGSPVCTSPISPIYSGVFTRSVQAHEYTAQFFDKNRPAATTMFKSGRKTFQLQRKSRAPRLGLIEEQTTRSPIIEEPATPPPGTEQPEGLFIESPPMEVIAGSPKTPHETPPRQKESPTSSPESPFSFRMRTLQAASPPYYSLDEMDVIVGRRKKTIKRRSEPPSVYKVRELPDDYSEEHVPFLAQVEAAGNWPQPKTAKFKIKAPQMDMVRESPVRVPTLFEVEDRTGFKKVREQLEKKFADLPQLPQGRPEDLIGHESYLSPTKRDIGVLDSSPPRDLPKPMQPPVIVPGWTTPPHLKVKRVKRPERVLELFPGRPDNIGVPPSLRDIILNEPLPEQIVYSPPPVSPKTMEELRPRVPYIPEQPPEPLRPSSVSPVAAPQTFGVVPLTESENIFEEDMPDYLELSPTTSPPKPRSPETPTSPPGSPFAFRIKCLQAVSPPYYSLKEMDVISGKRRRVVKRHSSPPKVHKIREVPDDYAEEHVPFLSQIEMATGKWGERKPKIVTAPRMSPVREEPMNVPGMFEVEDMTGFKKTRQQLEREFAYLPQLPEQVPEDMLGTAAPVSWAKTRTALDESPPKGLPLPIKPPTIVPGWSTPPHLRKEAKPLKPYEVKLIPGLRDVLFQEMPPPEMAYTPPRSPHSPLRAPELSMVRRPPHRPYRPVTPDAYMQPTPRPSPFLTPGSPSRTPPTIQGQPGQVFKEPARFLELEMPPDEFIPVDTPPSPLAWRQKQFTPVASPHSPNSTIDSFEELERQIAAEEEQKRRLAQLPRRPKLTYEQKEAARAATRLAREQLFALERGESPPGRLPTPPARLSKLPQDLQYEELQQIQMSPVRTQQIIKQIDPRVFSELPERVLVFPGPELELSRQLTRKYEDQQHPEHHRPETKRRIEEMIADIPDPHIPRRKPVISPTAKQLSPPWSPELPDIGEYPDQLEEEFVPQNVWGYSSPKTPPPSPPKPRQKIPSPKPQSPVPRPCSPNVPCGSPDIPYDSPVSPPLPNLFAVVPQEDYNIQDMLPPEDFVQGPTSPQSPPTPPNIADYYKPHTPPLSPGSPTGLDNLAEAVREHKFTNRYYDKNRKLMTDRLLIKNKTMRVKRHSAAPKFEPIQESPVKRSPPPVAELIAISPRATPVEIEEEVAEEIREINLQAPLGLPLLDKPVPQMGLGFGLADPRLTELQELQFISPPKRQPLAIPPKYVYTETAKDRQAVSPKVRRNLFEQDALEEGLLDISPPREYSPPRLSPGDRISPRHRDVVSRQSPEPRLTNMQEQQPSEGTCPNACGSANYELPLPNYYGSPGRTHVRTPHGPVTALEQPEENDVAEFQWMG